jgi:SWI/SNF-related matrix-associated actin-dependent regulator of chromatin subfamily A-like protein 1
LIICFDNDRYVAQSDFRERHTLKDAGFYWDGDSKLWFTRDPRRAVKLFDSCDDTCREVLTGLGITPIIEKEKKIVSSRALDADVDIPSPKGLVYMPFQRAGIDFINNRGNVLLGDEMGLGKTIQVIGYMNLCDGELSSDMNSDSFDKLYKYPVLIICPASLKRNWYNEITKWMVRRHSIVIVDSKMKRIPKAEIVIINYDIVKKFPEQLKAFDWEMIVCDEAHRLKNSKTGWTKVILGKKTFEYKGGIIEGDAKLVYLTGTPIPNRVKEIWTLISSLDSVQWRNQTIFKRRYCAAYKNDYGQYVDTGASNLDELQEKMRSSFMIRRLKSEVLTDLPSKFRQVIELDCNSPECRRVVAQELLEYDRKKARIKSLVSKVDSLRKSDNTDAYKDAVQKLNQARLTDLSKMAELRKATAVAKLPQVISHIKSVLLETKKVVVFAHHHVILDELIRQFPGSAVLTGKTSTSGSKRQDSVDYFQETPECRVFIGQIQAAGVGITLTASNVVIFAEMDWTHANMAQAEDRCHRIGQTKGVLVQYLVLDGSLDSHMAKMLVSKEDIANRALDKKPMQAELI